MHSDSPDKLPQFRLYYNPDTGRPRFMSGPDGPAGNYINITGEEYDIGILPNNHLLLFDNGNDRPDKKTRVVEYELDFEKKTATFVWGHTAPDDFPFRRCCGAVQRLANGNSFIAWGGWKIGAHDRESILVAQELSKTGDVVSEIRSTVEAMPYRVWKVEHAKSR